MIADSTAKAALARRSLVDFCRLMDPEYEVTPHTRAIITALVALANREIYNLILAIPPRHGKTYHLVRWIAWLLGLFPGDSIIMAGYASALVELSSREIRGLLRDERYPFDTKVASDSSAVERWATSAGGMFLASSVTAGTTGYGSNALVLDDLLKDREQADSASQRDKVWTYYTEVARTRLMPNAAGLAPIKVITQTRWHDDDIIGRILNSDDAKNWTVLCLPAIAEEGDTLGRSPGEALWEERYGIGFLREQQEVMGSGPFSALYQQDPVPAAAGLFRPEFFQFRYEGSL